MCRVRPHQIGIVNMSKIGIFVGSVYGNAQHVAEEVGAMLSEHGRESEVFTDPTLNDVSQVSSLLFISSTTGQGDIPPNLEFFIDDSLEYIDGIERSLKGEDNPLENPDLLGKRKKS